MAKSSGRIIELNSPSPRYVAMSPVKFIGVDVQAVSGCPYAVLDESGDAVDSGWLDRAAHGEIVRELRDIVDHQRAQETQVAIGIDAPRQPLPAARRWYWDGSRSKGREYSALDRGNGRHCEVVIAAHRIANPQWTPHGESIPEWMQLGFALFDGLSDVASVYEVFPSASYSLLSGESSLRLGIRLGDLAPGPKDMLDAHIAAFTVREFVQGRGQAVGGGDGHGEIILPRPLRYAIDPVLRWPG